MSNTHYDTSFKGLCYVNRVRMVKPSKADPYRAVTLSVKSGKRISTEGKGDKPEFTIPLDCKVVGTQAQTIFDQLLNQYWDDEHPPVISAAFDVGDIYPDTYVGTRGKNAGQTVSILKGRLLKLHDVYVKGERIDAEDAESESHDFDHAETAQAGSQDDGPATHGEYIPADAAADAAPAFPSVVRLSRCDPDFEERMARLKAEGYHWDIKEKVWRLLAA